VVCQLEYAYFPFYVPEPVLKINPACFLFSVEGGRGAEKAEQVGRQTSSVISTRMKCFFPDEKHKEHGHVLSTQE
jgi:hypothetical protein